MSIKVFNSARFPSLQASRYTNPKNEVLEDYQNGVVGVSSRNRSRQNGLKGLHYGKYIWFVVKNCDPLQCNDFGGGLQ